MHTPHAGWCLILALIACAIIIISAEETKSNGKEKLILEEQQLDPTTISSDDRDEPPTINLSCGPAMGSWITVQPRPDEPNGTITRVAAFKSIPYAEAPIGELRWQPPVPASCWSGTFNATEFGAWCVQPDGLGSEDCLQLSIYIAEDVLRAHQSNTLDTPVPVFFYIHGGGLTGGSGIFEVLAPFVSHAGPVISVVINYRLNIFGFLSIKEMVGQEVQANFGLLDQQEALRWTQANIAMVGGDPTRVTLGGQSSGGTSIFGLMSSKNSRGLFSGAIALSGSINTSMTIDQGWIENIGVPTRDATHASCITIVFLYAGLIHEQNDVECTGLSIRDATRDAMHARVFSGTHTRVANAGMCIYTPERGIIISSKACANSVNLLTKVVQLKRVAAAACCSSTARASQTSEGKRWQRW